MIDESAELLFRIFPSDFLSDMIVFWVYTSTWETGAI